MERPRMTTSTRPRLAMTPMLLLALSLALALAFSSIGCDSGTQGPDAPADDAGEQAASGSNAGAANGEQESAGEAAASREPIDPSRFPKDLPEGVEAAIPYNFPDDLPIYPGAQPAAGRGVQKDDGGQLSGVQLVTRDSAEQARAFYERELKDAGWSIDNVRELGGGTSISASKGSMKTILMISPSADGGSDIFVVSEG